MRTEIRTASGDEIARCYRELGKVAGSRVVVRRRRLVALGLLIRQSASVCYRNGTARQEERLWLNFEAYRGAGKASLAIVRAARSLMSDAAEPVYALCDEDLHPTAPRLLALCGLVPIDETWGGTKVWQKLP